MSFPLDAHQTGDETKEKPHWLAKPIYDYLYDVGVNQNGKNILKKKVFWDPDLKSIHMDLHKDESARHSEEENALSYKCYRHPVAESTDAALVRNSYSQGAHLLCIHWPNSQKGTHVNIGIGRRGLSLHKEGYRNLLGEDKRLSEKMDVEGDSYGWDMKNNKLRYKGKDHGKYPAGKPDFHFSKENIFCLLDANTGVVGFGSEEDYLGDAFVLSSGLKDWRLAISAVYGHTRVEVKYVAGIEGAPSLQDLCRVVIYRCLNTPVDQSCKALPLPRALREFIYPPLEESR